MAPGKLICNNRASSPENDHERDEKSTEDNIGVGRTYECSFCKRGFTNAQALGGHMNIHRKDKAKTKQAKKNQEEQQLSMTTRIDNYSNLMYNFPHDLIHSFDHHNHQFLYLQRLNYYMSVGREQAKYKMYLPQSNPNNNTVLQSASVHALRQGLYDHEDLSLKIGLMPYIEVNDDIAGISQRSENAHDQVDLELRLGHNPK